MTALKHDIVENGVFQGDLVVLLQNIRDNLNELTTDHATFKTSVDEAIVAVTELIADHATYKTIVDEMKTTVNALVTNMASRISEHNTLATKLNADGGVTDTNYAAAAAITAVAVANSSPATLTAGIPTAGPATLSNSTAITLAKG